MGLRVVDEATGEPEKLEYLLSFSLEKAMTDGSKWPAVLDNLSRQTGLDFKKEKRKMRVHEEVVITRDL